MRTPKTGLVCIHCCLEYDCQVSISEYWVLHVIWYQDPEVLNPSRWEGEAGKQLRIWTYGGGARECLGRYLSTDLIACVAEQLLERYDFTIQDVVPYKWLPVARPSKQPVAMLQRR